VQIDHIAVVVPNLERSITYYQEYFGYTWDGQIYVDPLQMARIAFIESADPHLRIELTEPTCADSPLSGPLKWGTRMVHICYRVTDIEQTLRKLVELGSRIIFEPRPALAFDGRRVAFVFTKDREVIELVESSPPAAGGDKWSRK
jgi:methylmalonyl-CoA/ethylmalonyl-CoA epimerase